MVEILEAAMTQTIPQKDDTFNALLAGTKIIANGCPCVCDKVEGHKVFATQVEYDIDGDKVERVFSKTDFNFEVI
jgi:hypothetical protein